MRGMRGLRVGRVVSRTTNVSVSGPTSLPIITAIHVIVITKDVDAGGFVADLALRTGRRGAVSIASEVSANVGDWLKAVATEMNSGSGRGMNMT